MKLKLRSLFSLCTLHDDALYLYQVHENIPKGFTVIERARILTDRQTRQTDTQADNYGKTICLPQMGVYNSLIAHFPLEGGGDGMTMGEK